MRSERVAEHWWPSWAKAEAFETTEPVTTADGRTVEVSAWENKQRSFSVGEGESGNIRVATFYYPHWRATVNGHNLAVGRYADGTMELGIPRERSEVELRFEEPLLNAIASWLSVATWILLFGSLAVRFYFLKRKALELNQ